MSQQPKVLLVGGEDIDARLDLMHCLHPEFCMSALGSHPALGEKFQAEGFEYNFYRLSRQASPLTDLKTLNELVKVFRDLKPEIVHTFDTKPAVWARLAARIAGIPIIIGTIPGLGSLYAGEDFKTRILRTVYQPLQKLASSVSTLTIFQNHDDAKQFISANIVSQEKTRVILGSGVDTSYFDPSRFTRKSSLTLRKSLGLKPNDIVITMISRLIRTKGVLEYATAARELGQQFDHVKFLLVGPDDRDSMDSLSKTELAELQKDIIWTGARKDVPQILAASDIFVLPSNYREGIPRVLLESASMGLPIITTNSPGCNEAVADQVNGFLIPQRDAQAITNNLRVLIEQPELRNLYGEASRKRAVEMFDLQVIAGQVKNVYQQILNNKN